MSVEQDREEQIQKLKEKAAEQEQLICEQKLYIERLEKENLNLSESFDTISNSTCWKITKPVRVTLDVIKWMTRPHNEKHFVRKRLDSLRKNGLRLTMREIINESSFPEDHACLTEQELFSEQELAEQRMYHFPQKIKFSIVVPLYNTPETFLRAMIESVLAQTYADWELCMADGSDGEHGDVERVCRKYAKKDRRIRYRKLEKNLGISGNTNACLEMAQGDYIGLFDHDDLLHPAALYEVMRAIEKTGADFICSRSFARYSSVVQRILAGLPTATIPSGMSWVTVLFAPIITSLPIVTPGKITDSAPIKTLSPIVTLPIFV